MPVKSLETTVDFQYAVANAVALRHGFVLRRFGDIHFRLHWPTGERLSIYPRDRHIFGEGRPKPPFITVSPDKRGYLIAVVEAAVRTAKRSTV